MEFGFYVTEARSTLTCDVVANPLRYRAGLLDSTRSHQSVLSSQLECLDFGSNVLRVAC